MTTDIVARFVEEAKKVYAEEPLHNYTTDEKINLEICNLHEKPYLFVLACIMDRQILAEKAWSIPYKVCDKLHINSFSELATKSQSEIEDCFEQEKLHRLGRGMGTIFYDAVQRIKTNYHGDASQIWNDEPTSATAVYRFLCFNGVGLKIATMAVNILARDFKIKFKDMYAIDVSADVHVCRILYRLGLIENEDRLAAIYKAKEINPSFPGLIDRMCWKYGRDYCHPTNPNCKECPISRLCVKPGIES